jgi:hypothetical protein
VDFQSQQTRIVRIGATCLVLGALFASPLDCAIAQQSASDAIGTLNDTEEYRLTASTGAIYSSGNYGGPSSTDIVVVPFNVRLSTGRLRLSATLPYLRIESPGNVVGAGDGPPIIIDPNAPTARTVRDGFGDLSLGAAFTLPKGSLNPFDIDLSGRVKLPTSSTQKSLGTGKTDFAVATEFSYPIETWAPYLTLGYRFFGDLPNINLKNGPTASIGTTKQFGRLVAILSYDYSRATTSAVEDGHEIFGALSGPLFGDLNWTGYAIAGLSSGSPDFGLGLLLTARLN